MPVQSNCSKVHPNRAPGPCAWQGCKVTGCTRWSHLQQLVKTNYAVYLYASERGVGETDCICRKCFQKINRLATATPGSDMEASAAKVPTLSPTESVPGGPDVMDLDVTQLSIRDESDLHILGASSDAPDHTRDGGNDGMSLSGMDRSTCCSLSNLTHSVCDGRPIEVCIDKDKFVQCFSHIWEYCRENVVDGMTTVLCRKHYNSYYKTTIKKMCTVCESSIPQYSRAIQVSNDRQHAFCMYMNTLLSDSNFQWNESEASHLCHVCYRQFDTYCNIDSTMKDTADSKAYLVSLRPAVSTCTEKGGVDIHCFHHILTQVIDHFILDTPLLLPSVFQEYKDYVTKVGKGLGMTVDELDVAFHSIRWLHKMLKSRLGTSLVTFCPEARKQGRMIYRCGSDLVSALHKTLHALEESSRPAKRETVSTPRHMVSNSGDAGDYKLPHVVDLLQKSVRSYANKNSATDCDIIDIRTFDVSEAIRDIDPTLWNFVYRLTATEAEESHLFKSGEFRWDVHYLHSPYVKPKLITSRLFHRLYICSCFFNTCNAECSQPLHLLMTDITDKYSNSSTALLTINSRIGAGVSKDTLKRYITAVSIQESKKGVQSVEQNFVVTSFDNLDKNQMYAHVQADKDRSGFHGTTVQSVEPLPITGKLLPEEIVQTDQVADHESSELDLGQVPSTSKRDRLIPSPLLQEFYNPAIAIHAPSPSRSNRFAGLSLEDFEITEEEHGAFQDMELDVLGYMTTKCHLREYDICIPGLKYVMALKSEKTTEQSLAHYVAVLDETADSKDTVLKVLNMIFNKFQVGRKILHIVVVGDGKSYDHLIKLKCEYGDELEWMLPFPGDWHILKNVQSILLKIFMDAGLKELALKHHRGATLNALLGASRFPLTHRFLMHVWEAAYRKQILAFQDFLRLKNMSPTPFHHSKRLFEKFAEDLFVSRPKDDQTIWSSVAELQHQLRGMLDPVNNAFQIWRQENSEVNECFRFWDGFIHRELMSYVGLYLAVRSRNWLLRMASLKMMAGLFHAFDRQNYLKFIAYHIADLQTFPRGVIEHFRAGGFTVSITGKHWFSVACDESHEMLINREVKAALNSTEKTNLTALTCYLPFRAKALQNVRQQLQVDSEVEEHGSNAVSVNFVKKEEQTVRQYVDQLGMSSLFSPDCRNTLHHIFTGADASAEQREGLLNYSSLGKEDYKNYVRCGILQDTVSIKRQKHNLKMFTAPKATVTQKQREVKDQQLVVSCLRKKIGWLKENPSMAALCDLEQFSKFPRAICTADGLPEKGTKSNITKSLMTVYKDAFSGNVPEKSTPDLKTCVIIEGMFMINTQPLGHHQTYGDYAEFLFDRWVVQQSAVRYSASEVHVVFDDPNRHGVSPKDLERQRRDAQTQCQSGVDVEINCSAKLPQNWRTLLANRAHKRLLVNFLACQFLVIAARPRALNKFLFVSAGGYSGLGQDMALCLREDKIEEYGPASCNHEEGDTRVWKHALACNCDRIIIYSPDTDCYFVGLPLMRRIRSQVHVHLTDTPYKKLFLNMNILVDRMSNDLPLQSVCSERLADCFQMLYISTGCDYVSYFKGIGKTTFLNVFRRNASFICGESSVGKLWEVDRESEGFLSFCRLIGAAYFAKHHRAFVHSSPCDLLNSLSSTEASDRHAQFVGHIREKLWDHIKQESEMMPNMDALKLHWLRSCWVYQLYSEADSRCVTLPDMGVWGWNVDGEKLSVVWDTELNVQKVERNLLWFTAGCSCKRGCVTNRCKCWKFTDPVSGIVGRCCGPGCTCINCKNRPGSGRSGNATAVNVAEDVAFSDSESDGSDIDVDWPVLSDDDYDLAQGILDMETDDMVLDYY